MTKISNIKYQISKRGFTLIELLVVISIIGILSTLVMVNMAGVRERARDAQRKSDISQIQKALEMYKGSQSIVSYPASASWRNSLQTGNFMKAVPNDPNCPEGSCIGTWRDYSYTSPVVGTDTLTYKLITCLENKSDPQKDSDQLSCPSWCKTDAGGACFTRTEP